MDRSDKRSSLEIKKRILLALSDNLEHSFADLERKVNTNWKSIRNHCEELEFFNIIEYINNKVKIKEEGLLFLKKLNKS